MVEGTNTGRVAARLPTAGEGTGRTGALQEVEEVLFGGAELGSVGSSNKESIAVMAISVPFLMTYRPASNSEMQEWTIRRSSKGKGRTIIRGKGSSKDDQYQMTLERSSSYGMEHSIY